MDILQRQHNYGPEPKYVEINQGLTKWG
jgi:hypothetical protein